MNEFDFLELADGNLLEYYPFSRFRASDYIYLDDDDYFDDEFDDDYYTSWLK